MQKKKIKKICYCGNSFFTWLCWVRRGSGKYCSRFCMFSSKERNKKISESKIDSKNPMWRGEKANLPAIHKWIQARKKKPIKCEFCKKSSPMDLANISQKYYRDIKDFQWLCRRCHMQSDGRMNNLKQYSELSID